MKKTYLWAVLINVAFAAAASPSFGEVKPPVDPVPPFGQVNIFRDIYGVPHVYAAYTIGEFFSIGYALSEDNLEKILFRPVVVSGKLASVPYGQRSDLASPYYSDQSSLIRDKQLKPTFFNYSSLKNNLESFVTVIITP